MSKAEKKVGMWNCGLHTSLFMRLHGTRLKTNSERVWLRIGRWPDTSYFRTGPRLYRSDVKLETNLRPGASRIACFFVRLHFAFFF